MLCNNCDDIKPNDYLYHYTSLETLALILKNRTIRFNSLLNVDDLQEKESRNCKNLGQFCFVSCWTGDEIESIPMWKMYGDWTAGVRIGLPRDPFKLVKNVIRMDNTKNISFLFSDMNNKIYHAFNPYAIASLLTKVIYTKEKNLLFPDDDANKQEYVSRKLNGIGVYKNKHWEFQNEYRYLFYAFPVPLGKNLTNEYIDELEENLKQDKVFVTLNYRDLELTDEAFSKMKIVLSPRITAGNRIIANTLVEKYNPTASIMESTLTGIVR